VEAYLVTDRHLASEDFLGRLLRDAAGAGVDRIQIREKDLEGRALTRLVLEALQAIRGTRATLFVNDRIDVALAAGAQGVHLGRSGIPPDVARRIAGDDLVLGVSTHTLEEVMEAQERGADYLFFGPVFPTASKIAWGPPAGIPKLEAVLRMARVPVYAIGGISGENVERLRGLPLAGVAMISAFVRAPSIPDLVRRIHGAAWK
jgi:thiamine-phosphate pyrophosphorylase